MKSSVLTTIVSLMAAASWLTAPAAEVIDVTTAQGRHLTIDVVTPDIIRVTNLAKGEKDFRSLDPAVSSAGDVHAPKVDSFGNMRTFTTSAGVTVRADVSTGAVDITAGGGRSVYDNGVRTMADGKQRMELSTMGSGSFYGAGERGYSFNLAGDTLVMYNKQNYGYTADETRIKQMNISMPLFLSSTGYAIVFDDYAAAEMVMENPIVYITESPDPVSWYFVNSTGTLASLTTNLSQLTGRQELPPLWSLGYITSKYGYHTEDETLGVVDTLKRAGYPLDGVVLDLYWYGKEEDMGRLAWDPEQWPHHKEMLSSLKKDGVNTVIISQPYVLSNGRGLDNFNELSSKGLLLKDSLGNLQDVKIWVGDGGMFDVSNPETRAWLRNRYKDLTLEGVGGWWGDLGEPEVHPESGLHANGKTTRQYHNKYGNDWSQIIYDLYKEEFPDTRLMTMMRGGTTGLQRYSVFPWSTDVSRSWGGMQPQVNIMLNSGLSGLGYMSHDVGGFAINPDAPYDPELYVRWLQLGTFSPVLRTHAQATAEPYNYPDQQHIILPLIKERYRWLPYNYTLAYENASQGLPLVRPLNFYTPGSSKYDDISDEYLWGRDVLVAPVMTKGATERKVILPEGLWADYRDPSRFYSGGDTVTVAAPLDVIPLFVRAGAFIPTADYDMNNTGDLRADRLTVNYYPYLGESEYTMYEDNPLSTTSLQSGEYRLITFKGDAQLNELTVDVSAKGTYPGAPQAKELKFVIHLFDGKPTEVLLDGRKAKGWKFNDADKTFTITTKWNTDKKLKLEIK
ncbi:MAG: DUF5110 domain-containing protein [Muribaculaceae bacterium]|nr:DUF5110 domain-containing protein [Muribaculaceae bacterium]